MAGAEDAEDTEHSAEHRMERGVLESFSESREVSELIAGLRGAFAELVTREMALERFVGEHGEGAAPADSTERFCYRILGWIGLEKTSEIIRSNP
ncbi:hypothetical protein WISP_00687 [Willisornis vidua]|uniref:Uncharacterized protein n=1 Tax=Willisornis vidua TaxID=1566151 RepID=A0ABQ9E0Z9_9PASS|nr:hypothetical protein WISP_00687 [Willisornis vidua]